MYIADVACSRTYRWTQVAEIVGTRHAERKYSAKILSRANLDHPVQSAPSAGSIPSTLVSIIAIGTAMKTNCSWKASPSTVAIGKPSAAKNYHIAPPPTSRIGQSTLSSIPHDGPSDIKLADTRCSLESRQVIRLRLGRERLHRGFRTPSSSWMTNSR